MHSLDLEVQTRFDAALMQNGVPSPTHGHYRKWLRCYLDFCYNHHHAPTEPKSFAPFARKLKDKRQTEYQREQAYAAVSIFNEMRGDRTNKGGATALKIKSGNKSTNKSRTPSTGNDWRPVDYGLESEIKIRHYSLKTWAALQGMGHATVKTWAALQGMGQATVRSGGETVVWLRASPFGMPPAPGSGYQLRQRPVVTRPQAGALK